jgi:hypothetical protein
VPSVYFRDNLLFLQKRGTCYYGRTVLGRRQAIVWCYLLFNELLLCPWRKYWSWQRRRFIREMRNCLDTGLTILVVSLISSIFLTH